MRANGHEPQDTSPFEFAEKTASLGLLPNSMTYGLLPNRLDAWRRLPVSRFTKEEGRFSAVTRHPDKNRLEVRYPCVCDSGG